MRIQNFKQMLSLLSAVSFGSEKYYSLWEAFAQFEEIGPQGIEIENSIITPYYVDSNRRMELDAFELTLAVVSAKNPIEAYLRERTGHADLSEVAPSVISRLKHCYLEALTDDRCLTGSALARYCSYLFTSEELRGDINSRLESFEPSKLYFSYFDAVQERFL